MRKDSWIVKWLEKIGMGAVNGALDNEHAQDGVNNMVGSVLKKYKWYLIGGGVAIGLLILLTLAGLFRTNRTSFKR
jgi:hypothetical protein